MLKLVMQELHIKQITKKIASLPKPERETILKQEVKLLVNKILARKSAEIKLRHYSQENRSFALNMSVNKSLLADESNSLPPSSDSCLTSYPPSHRRLLGPRQQITALLEVPSLQLLD